MSSRSDSAAGVGCAAVFALAVIVAAVLWALAIALWVLGLLVLLGGVIGGIALIVHGWRGVRRRREVRAIESEVDAMNADCIRQLTSLQADWDMFVYTKGVGTKMQQAMYENSAIGLKYGREISSATAMCEGAPLATQKLQAICDAEATRLKINDLMEP